MNERRVIFFLLLQSIVIVVGLVHLSFAQQQRFDAMTNDQFLSWLSVARSTPITVSTLSQPARTCGLDIASEAMKRFPSFTASQRDSYRRIMAPMTTDTSITSASGKFIIKFDLTGPNEPAMLNASGDRIPGTAMEFAREAAAAFDRSYTVEIDSMGYAAPPRQRTASAYIVVIKAQQPGVYGQTIIDEYIGTSHPAPIATSYIEIDNDFIGLYSRGVKGLRVTAAHEFHHMIQIGSYGFWDYSQEGFFYEMSSTYMEDYVYTEVNDYYYYLTRFDSILKRPEQAFFSGAGYDLAIYPKLLEQRYTPVMLRRTWEKIMDLRTLTANDRALWTQQSDLASEYCTFALWNYYTSYRAFFANTSETYLEANAYPLVGIRNTQEILNGSAHVEGKLPPLSTSYVQVYKGVDTVTFIVANINVTGAFTRSTVETGYTLDVQQTGGDGSFKQLSNGWRYKFTPEVQGDFCVTAVVSNSVQGEVDLPPYPNPFSPHTDNYITFVVPKNVQQTTVQLTILSPSVDLIYDGTVKVFRESNLAKVKWDGRANSGSYAASGMYIYVLSYGGEVKTGKFSLINK